MGLTTAGVTLGFLVGLVQNFSAVRPESSVLFQTHSRYRAWRRLVFKKMCFAIVPLIEVNISGRAMSERDSFH